MTHNQDFFRNRKARVTRSGYGFEKGEIVEIKRKFKGLGCLSLRDREKFVYVPAKAVELILEE